MMHSVQLLPPKMAQQFAERWNEGFALSDHVREFVQGNNVICVFGPENPHGHIKRAPKRADELRRLLGESNKK